MLLWRVTSNLRLPALETFADGSWRSQIFAAADRARVNPVTVRVIEYTLKGCEGKRSVTGC